MAPSDGGFTPFQPSMSQFPPPPAASEQPVIPPRGGFAPPPVAPVGQEPTEVLGERPDYAPGQQPGQPSDQVALGKGRSGTTGPWGPQGFAAAAAQPPAGFPPAPPTAVPQPPVGFPAAPVSPGVPVTAPAGPRPVTGVRKVDQATDHDGETVFTTGIAATHKPAAGRNSDDHLVLAAICGLGHANAPGSTQCRLCGGGVDSHNPQLVNRPILAVLSTSSGEQMPLAGPILIGRAPANSGNDLSAELLRVPSPNHDISRTHVRVAPHEWTIEVTDLYSTNGTVVVTPTGQQIRLEPGQTTESAVGGQIDLGDGQVIHLNVPR